PRLRRCCAVRAHTAQRLRERCGACVLRHFTEPTMSYQLEPLAADDSSYGPDALRGPIDKLLNSDGPRYRRLWAYYRNPIRACGVSDADRGSERPYRQAQEWGLPSRSPACAAARMFLVLNRLTAWRAKRW